VGRGGGCCEHGNEPSGPVKAVNILTSWATSCFSVELFSQFKLENTGIVTCFTVLVLSKHSSRVLFLNTFWLLTPPPSTLCWPYTCFILVREIVKLGGRKRLRIVYSGKIGIWSVESSGTHSVNSMFPTSAVYWSQRNKRMGEIYLFSCSTSCIRSTI
jgi:hypothetical protein